MGEGDRKIVEELAHLDQRLKDLHGLVTQFLENLAQLGEAKGRMESAIQSLEARVELAHGRVSALAKDLRPDESSIEKRVAAANELAIQRADVERRLKELEKIRTGWWSFWGWVGATAGAAAVLKIFDWVLSAAKGG